MTTGSVISLYVEYQTGLANHGDTAHTRDLFFRLAKLIEADPFLDNEGFDAALERLHRAAYPVASTRPPRLTAGEIADIRE